MLQTFFTRSTLEGNLKSTWALKQSKGTQRALKEHSRGTLVTLRRHSKVTRRRLEGNFGSQRELKGMLMGTRWAREDHRKDTWALKALEALKALYLADSLGLG